SRFTDASSARNSARSRCILGTSSGTRFAGDQLPLRRAKKDRCRGAVARRNVHSAACLKICISVTLHVLWVGSELYNKALFEPMFYGEK
ncbi:hypothetical protein RSW31_24905, partial [Escherichia coli]|uniref:hypothetical protein n=1 Tax=Escherichia coli TaxID=562 RepID=UPI0028DE64C1